MFRLKSERSRSIEKTVKVDRVVSRGKTGDNPKRVATLSRSQRRDMPLKLKAKAVAKLESDIKGLVSQVSKSITRLSSEIVDDICAELIRFQVSIQHFHKESKLFFNSSIGKYLNSLCHMLEIAESSSSIDLTDLNTLLKKVMKDSARIITLSVINYY